MSLKAFFSYDYGRDAFRAKVVRDAWLAQGGIAELETTRQDGDEAIKQWIDGHLADSSVTAVLVGAHTFSSHWVKYEIEKSLDLGMGLIGIDVSGIEDQFGNRTERGSPPPDDCPFYDWLADNGHENISAWIEEAARRAGFRSDGSHFSSRED